MTDSALASAAAEVEEDFFRFQTLETLFGLLEEEHLPEWLPAFPNIIGCLLVAGDTRDAIEPQSVGRFRHANIIAVCYTRSDTSTVQYSRTISQPNDHSQKREAKVGQASNHLLQTVRRL